MKKTIFILLYFFVVPNFGEAVGQDAMFKALFMYNFTKYIDWPSSYKSGDFVIGVLGNNAIISELHQIAKRKSTGNQPIRVKKFSSVENITKCHILYIPPNRSANLGAALKKLKNKPTLIITDQKGLTTRGACINYVKINGNQKFEISKQNIERRGLKVSSFLMNLAIRV